MDRCKHCGARLADDGFCSRPCRRGDLDRRIDAERREVEAEKKGAEE